MVERAVEAVSPPDVTDAVRAAAETFRDGIARRAPRRSGRLAASFRVNTVSAYEAEAVSDLMYARPQEEGAFIRPVRARALVFNAGGPQFRKWIRVKKQPYVSPTFAADANKAFDTFCDHIEQSI